MAVEVVISKLVHGGQGLGTLPDGRKIFVWNALPGESVAARVIRQRKDYAEGVAERIIEPSSYRVQPVDEAYLSTSPWQIIDPSKENDLKADILYETFQRAGLNIERPICRSAGTMLHYRNKMEYSFWADETGLHLALFHRGSKGKRIVEGSSIARPEIDKTAQAILQILNKYQIRGSQLKTVIVRVNQAGDTVAALFVKDEMFPDMIELNEVCSGVEVIYSTPKSPASVISRRLYLHGSVELQEKLLSTSITYNVHSFFQVNIPVFVEALGSIKDHVAEEKNIVDMYAGVGTIGLVVGAQILVELDPENVEMAKRNATNAHVVQASTEQTLEHIDAESCVIFDPPRAGLHKKIVKRVLEVRPSKIVYLSCNPATQARDIALLHEVYKIKNLEGYNFFPRTPHIESLAVLQKKV